MRYRHAQSRPTNLSSVATLSLYVSTWSPSVREQTSGLDVIGAREISALGIVLTAGVLLLLGLVWGMSRRADHRNNTAEVIENKVVDWYIATGEVRTLSP